MKVECALGDVVDRVTILLIKERRITDGAKLANVRSELAALRSAWEAERLPEMTSLTAWSRLAEVNEALWDVEDALREHEKRHDFGPRFVELARSVYELNDERARLKKEINVQLGSAIIEEKSYAGS